MNYYKRHIGDYAKKAGHLSVMEHGVYTLLLDSYYDREQAPTKAEAIRIARARTPEELAALDAVLSDFFVLDGGKYTQKRVEEEFVKAEEQARLNAENGRKGGRPRKPKGLQKESEQKAKLTQPVIENNPDVSETKGNPLIHQSTNSTDQKKEHASPSGSRLPADWSLPTGWYEWAVHERPDIDPGREAEGFRDYWHSVAGAKGRKADWQATWRNWIRRADKPKMNGASNGKQSLIARVIEKNQRNQLADDAQRHSDPDLVGEDDCPIRPQMVLRTW